MIHPFPRRPIAGDSKASRRSLSTRSRQVAATLVTAISACAVLQTPLALAEQFTPPSLEGFSLHSERDADGDDDGMNETHIQQYMNMHGDSLFSMTTRERTWAWSLDTRDSDSGPSNYVIRDSDCDGIFDEVYGLDEEFHVPECLK